MTPRRARLVQGLASRMAAQTVSTPAENELEIEVAPDDLGAAARMVVAERGHFLTAYATKLDGLRVHYVFDIEGEDLVVILRAALAAPTLPALAAFLPAAAWPERAIRQDHGITFSGHPDPRPLAPGPDGAVTVEGEGVHMLRLGPAQGLLGEAAALRFALHGERIIHLEPLLGFKRRRAEERIVGLQPAAALALVERTCGHCALGNAAGFAQALEHLAGAEPPRRARWLRTALVESERIASHALVLGEVLAATGFESLAHLAERQRERLRAALEAATGSRLGFGALAVGGTRRDLSAAEARAWVRAAREAGTRLRQVADDALGDQTFAGMLTGQGILPAELAREWESTGPVARGSGSRRDARRDHPYDAYQDLHFWVPLYSTGDSLGRFRIHADELQQSSALVEETLDNLPTGPVRTEVGKLPARGRALALVETPRGAALHAVHSDADGRLARWHLGAPAISNWQALAATAPGSLLRDFPVAQASFGLCVGCVDR